MAARELTAEQLGDYKRRYQLFLDPDVRVCDHSFQPIGRAGVLVLVRGHCVAQRSFITERSSRSSFL